jgi:hypothetical protein
MMYLLFISASCPCSISDSRLKNGDRSVLGFRFKRENTPLQTQSKRLFGHVVVHYFILPLQLKPGAILLQGQNKERALQRAKKLAKARKEQIIFLSLYRYSVNIVLILWFYIYWYVIFYI